MKPWSISLGGGERPCTGAPNTDAVCPLWQHECMTHDDGMADSRAASATAATCSSRLRTSPRHGMARTNPRVQVPLHHDRVCWPRHLHPIILKKIKNKWVHHPQAKLRWYEEMNRGRGVPCDSDEPTRWPWERRIDLVIASWWLASSAIAHPWPPPSSPPFLFPLFPQAGALVSLIDIRQARYASDSSRLFFTPNESFDWDEEEIEEKLWDKRCMG